MSKQEPLVSVVTPVYNGEQYLRECIESVLAQTYTSWDYTIVNNYSTDRTFEIAREYADKEPRIHIHNNNTFVRVNENYNIALRQILPESKYCKVVAADDWLFPECLEQMVRLAEEHPNVVIVGAYWLRENQVAGGGLPYHSTVVPGIDVCRLRLLDGYLFGTPTAVLYRSNIVRSRYSFYNESNFHADSEACFEFLEQWEFGFVHQILTFRRVQEGSLTSFSRRFNTYLAGDLYELAKYGERYLSQEELKHRIRAHLRKYYRYLGNECYKWRGKEFWNYHRRKLAELGYPLNMFRLVVAAGSYVMDLMLNPKSTVEKVVGRLSRTLSRSTE